MLDRGLFDRTEIRDRDDTRRAEMTDRDMSDALDRIVPLVDREDVCIITYRIVADRIGEVHTTDRLVDLGEGETVAFEFFRVEPHGKLYLIATGYIRLGDERIFFKLALDFLCE